jgi:hypothetical protein
MKKILSILFALVMIVGMAGATYSAVSAVVTLDELNDYTVAPAAWTSIATSTNYNYVAYDGSYDYIIGVNVTVVGTSPTFNIEQGTNPPAFRSSIGDKSYTLTNNTVRWFGPLESARFVNSTGYLQFSTTNVTTGKIMVLKVKS